jgi:hypothetical protein
LQASSNQGMKDAELEIIDTMTSESYRAVLAEAVAP